MVSASALERPIHHGSPPPDLLRAAVGPRRAGPRGPMPSIWPQGKNPDGKGAGESAEGRAAPGAARALCAGRGRVLRLEFARIFVV